MTEPCRFEDKIIEMAEGIASIKTSLSNAIRDVSSHINAGTKYRLAILCSCIGLVGTILGGIVRFSVMEYKVTTIQNEQLIMKNQIYDLNYEKGRIAGMAER